MAWTGDASLSGLEIKGEGRPPSGPDQVAIDKATADREDFAVGDTIEVITDTGTHDVHDHRPGRARRQRRVRRRHARRVGRRHGASRCSAPTTCFDGIDVAVAEGVDPATVQARIEEILPDAPRSSPATC